MAENGDPRLQKLKLERTRLDDTFPEVLQLIDKGKFENVPLHSGEAKMATVVFCIIYLPGHKISWWLPTM